MTPSLSRAVFALIPAGLLLFWSLTVFVHNKSAWPAVQLLGAVFLVIVILTHLCEALHWLPWMHWGEKHSLGHYIDFCSAALGISLFPAGYLFGLFRKPRASAHRT